MFDEAGRNWDAIEKVFGKKALEQCVSCEFHFFQCCNSQVHTDWSDKSKHTFKTLSRNIFKAPTPYQYDQARKELVTLERLSMMFTADGKRQRQLLILSSFLLICN